MTAPDKPLETSTSSDTSLGRDILAWAKFGIYRLRSRLGTRGLVILGGAVIVAGLAFNWSWLVAIGVAPLLLTALPCLAMCALGVCMMPKRGESREDQSAADEVRHETTALPGKSRPHE